MKISKDLTGCSYRTPSDLSRQVRRHWPVALIEAFMTSPLVGWRRRPTLTPHIIEASPASARSHPPALFISLVKPPRRSAPCSTSSMSPTPATCWRYEIMPWADVTSASLMFAVARGTARGRGRRRARRRRRPGIRVCAKRQGRQFDAALQPIRLCCANISSTTLDTPPRASGRATNACRTVHREYGVGSRTIKDSMRTPCADRQSTRRR